MVQKLEMPRFVSSFKEGISFLTASLVFHKLLIATELISRNNPKVKIFCSAGPCDANSESGSDEDEAFPAEMHTVKEKQLDVAFMKTTNGNAAG